MTRALFAALIATSMLATPAVALAKQASEPAAMAGQQEVSKADYDHMMKLSDDGFRTMRDVKEARLAIFNAAPDQALKRVDDAINAIGKAKKDAKSFVGRTSVSKSSDEWLPFDATIDVADNYVVGDEKSKHVAEANAELKAGKGQKAAEKLKLAAIDVNLTRLMMPLTATTSHLSLAKSLLGEKKYYEANQALQAVEDGIVVDTIALIDVPKSSTLSSASAGSAVKPAPQQHASAQNGNETKTPSSN